jgi:predicted phosphodiesterase
VGVFITHIGGYPGKYAPGIKELLLKNTPKLFICGHSHILKVMPDPTLKLLHMNPGACGQQGWHKVKTLLRFELSEGNISNLEVIELPK